MSERKARLVILACAVSLMFPISRPGRAQEAPKPWTKAQILHLLNGDVLPQRVEQLAREHGIDFQVTAEVEGELRQAGQAAGDDPQALNAMIATLRQLAPKPPVVNPAPAAPPETIKPGTVKVNSKDGLKYVWIPPGSFMMGCSPGDTECTGDEKPSHQVTISKGLWLGQTPVTVAAYRRYSGTTGAAMPQAPNFNSGWNDQEMPIVDVSWNDAVGYCRWAGGRLPTEAEWEYAARAGSTESRYGPIDDVAWYSNNSGGKTHEVGQKRANAFGFYDILGNVWEWVNDWYGENYYPASPEGDPKGPNGGQLRVLRGGSWVSVPRDVRVSFRLRFGPDYRYDGIGVRCAREVDSP